MSLFDLNHVVDPALVLEYIRELHRTATEDCHIANFVKAASVEGVTYDRLDREGFNYFVMTARAKENERAAELPVKAIPIRAAEKIAQTYGYDQVVIMARRPGTEEDITGEHVTTYGRNPTHCAIAAMMGNKLKEIAGWPDTGLRERMFQRLRRRQSAGADSILYGHVDAMIEEMKR